MKIKNIEEQEVINCPVCNSEKKKFYTQGNDYEYLTCENTWKFFKCENCNLLYLDPRPHLDEINTIYPSYYYSSNYEEINFIARFGKQFLDNLKFKSFLSFLRKDEFKYLDIGCGNGRYLEVVHKKFKQKKVNCFGLEFENNKLKELKKEGYQIFFDSIDDFVTDNKFDLITMFHVIEHVANPSEQIKKIYDCLSDEGVLVIETPNHQSIDHILFASKYWGGYHIPRHFTVFHEHSLKKMLLDNNLKILKTFFKPGHYFWQMSLYNLVQDKYKYLGFIKNFLSPFKILGLPLLILFTVFDIIRSKFGFKTSTILLVIKKNS